MPTKFQFELVCGDINSATFDLVFIHGITGDPRDTWTNIENEFWPTWLAEDVKGANIYTAGYPSSLFEKWARNEMDLHEQASSLVEHMVSFGLGNRPIAFICHSLGGILAKEILRAAHESSDCDWNALAENLKLMSFMATPHRGAGIATVLEKLFPRLSSNYIKELGNRSGYLTNLNHSYRDLANKESVQTIAFYEKQKTKDIAIIVSKDSADPGGLTTRPIPVDADHIGICKPDNRDAPVYLSLLRHVRKIHTSKQESTENKMCPFPNCKEPVFERISTKNGNEAIWLCSSHANDSKEGKVSMNLLKSISEWLSGVPQPYHEIHSRPEILKYLVGQATQSDGINMRLNYVGPLFLHPDWYHDRRDEMEYPAPNLERILFSQLSRRKHKAYHDVKIILRNVPRYLAKVDSLVAPNELPCFVEAMLERLDEVWQQKAQLGPDLLCMETGFHRHPFIFSRAVVDVTRKNPASATSFAIVQKDENFVGTQRTLFDEIYQSCEADRTAEYQKLRAFIMSITKRN